MTNIKKILSVQVTAELLWWYLALLIPTLAVKYYYFTRIYREGLSVAVESIGQGSPLVKLTVAVILLFGRDVPEVLALVLLLYALGRGLPRVDTRWLIATSILVSLVIGGANLVSFEQLNTYLTLDAFLISTAWIWHNPDLLTSYVTSKKVIMLFMIAGIWPWLPRIIGMIIPRDARMLALHRHLRSGALVAVAAAGIAHLVVVLMLPTSPPLSARSYWSATLASLVGSDARNPLKAAVVGRSQPQGDYDRLVYPGGKGPEPRYLIDVPREALRPRHIVVVQLETAPRKYYPIVNNPELPNLFKMSRQALVSDRHYSNTPFTNWATFAMVSGIYPNPGGKLAKYGDFETDGVATVLKRRGYQTSLIDSFKTDWRRSGTNTRVLRSLGFERIHDTSTDERLADTMFRRSYAGGVYGEARSFQRAMQAIAEAQADGKRAMVFIVTLLGHYEWKAKPGGEQLSGQQKIYGIAKAFDALLGSTLAFFDRHGLGNDVLILVTGDHGLRYRQEFRSLDEHVDDWDVRFNVPFLLYAPGLIKAQVEIPYVTSHVDVTPTLLNLLGIKTEGLFHHGLSVLDERARDRVTFMMNTALSPIDGFHWNGYVITVNNLTGETRMSRNRARSEGQRVRQTTPVHAALPGALRDPEHVLKRANDLFTAAAGAVLSRTAEGAAPLRQADQAVGVRNGTRAGSTSISTGVSPK